MEMKTFLRKTPVTVPDVASPQWIWKNQGEDDTFENFSALDGISGPNFYHPEENLTQAVSPFMSNGGRFGGYRKITFGDKTLKWSFKFFCFCFLLLGMDITKSNKLELASALLSL